MFKGTWWKVGMTVGLVATVGLLIAGCGGGSNSASQSEIAQAEKHARQEKTEKEKERRLERKLQTLERENREAKKRREEKARKAREEVHVVAPVETSPAQPSTPSGTDCGDGVIAGPETSCGFALNTRSEYEREIGAGSGSIEAWSEDNERWYPMYCTEASEHECSGAISATVFWP